MELFCALLTGFFLWLFLFHLVWSRRERMREEAGPLLFEIKLARRIVWQLRLITWFGIAVLLAAAAAVAVFLFRVSRGTFFPNLPDILLYNFLASPAAFFWSFNFFLIAIPPKFPRTALEIREEGVLVRGFRLRRWSTIGQFRWLAPKKWFGIAFSWRSLPYNRFRLTVNERTIARRQKDAATAVLARFVQVFDHDGTLLAGPSQAELVARRQKPAPRCTRAWLQFNLQSMLLLVVVVSCAASCYGIHYRRLQPQYGSVARLEVFSPAIGYFGNVAYNVDFSKCVKKPTDDDLACLASLDQLSFLDLSGSPITDAGTRAPEGPPQSELR